eukprot:3703727-Pyramimonas_sp.AAC.1
METFIDSAEVWALLRRGTTELSGPPTDEVSFIFLSSNRGAVTGPAAGYIPIEGLRLVRRR